MLKKLNYKFGLTNHFRQNSLGHYCFGRHQILQSPRSRYKRMANPFPCFYFVEILPREMISVHFDFEEHRLNLNIFRTSRRLRDLIQKNSVPIWICLITFQQHSVLWLWPKLLQVLQLTSDRNLRIFHIIIINITLYTAQFARGTIIDRISSNQIGQQTAFGCLNEVLVRANIWLDRANIWLEAMKYFDARYWCFFDLIPRTINDG